MLAVTVVGCDRFPDNGLQIIANLPPDDSCTLSSDQDIRLLRGRWDVAYRDISTGEPADYLIAPLLRSYLITNALEFQGEQANIQVDNFDITILTPDGTVLALPAPLRNPYRVTTSAVIPANEDNGQSTDQVAGAIGIPGNYQDAINAILADTGFSSILLDIRAGGTTFGGFSQRSAPFRWPVDVCTGCLESCIADDIEESCLPGQDVWPYCTTPIPTP
jgi:hypothetical protein